MAPGDQRIVLEVDANTTEFQAAIERAAAALKELATTVTVTTDKAIADGRETVASNEGIADSYQRTLRSVTEATAGQVKAIDATVAANERAAEVAGVAAEEQSAAADKVVLAYGKEAVAAKASADAQEAAAVKARAAQTLASTAGLGAGLPGAQGVAGTPGATTVIGGGGNEIFGARGPTAPGSVTNPIVVAVEAGQYTGMGTMAAAIGEKGSVGGKGQTADVAAQAVATAAEKPGGSGTLTTADVAQLLGVSRATAREQAASGALAGSQKVGGQWQIPQAAVDAAAAKAAADTAASGGGGGGGGIMGLLGGLFSGGGGGGGGSILSKLLWGGGGMFGLGAGFGSIGSFAGLGPEHAVMTGVGLGGSAVGAGLGAGLLGGGALADVGVGAGSDLGVTASAISDTELLYKDYTNLTNAVAEYGKNSKQASAAQQQLNFDMKTTLAGTPGVSAELGLAKQLDALNTKWDQTTSQARIDVVKIGDQLVQLANVYMPLVVAAADKNLPLVNAGLKPLTDWLEGPGTKVWTSLEDVFAKNLPTAMQAFDNAVELAIKTVDLPAIQDRMGGFIRTIDEFVTRMNTTDFGDWTSHIDKLVNDFEIWKNLVVILVKDIFDLFENDAGTGSAIVVTLTQMLDKLNEWEKSTSGASHLHDIFEVHKNEVLALLKLLPPLVEGFGRIYLDVAPALTQAMTGILTAIAGILNALLKLSPAMGTLLGLTLIAAKLHVLGPVLSSIAGSMGLIGEKTGGIAANTAAVDANTKALDANAAAAQRAAAAQGELGAREGLAGAGGAAEGVAGMGLVPMGATETTAAAEVPAAEEAAVGGEIVASMKTGLQGILPDLLKGGLIAGLGVVVSQIVGSEVKKVTGSGIAAGAVSNVGAGAAIGAGLGSVIPGLGTITGAISGAALGGLVTAFEEFSKSDAARYGDEVAKKFTAPLGPTVQAEYAKPIEDALNRAKGLATAAAAPNVGGVAGALNRALTPTTDDVARSAAAFAEAGKEAGDALVTALQGVKAPTQWVLIQDFESRLATLPAQSRDSAAEAMVEFAGSLAKSGQIPETAVTNIITALEGKFPGLTAYVQQQGLQTSQAVADALTLTQAQANWKAAIENFRSTYDDYAISQNVTSQNIVSNTQQAMTALQGVIATGSSQQRAAAEQQYHQLQTDVATTWQNMSNQVASKQAAMTASIQSGSARATSDAASNLYTFASDVAKTMQSGLESTGKGSSLIAKALVETLKAFGATKMPQAAINASEYAASAIPNPPQFSGGNTPRGAASGGWVGTPGERGRDTVHAVLGRGEAVLNHPQQHIVNQSLAQTGVGSLDDVFAGTAGSMHYLASGGYAGGGVVSEVDQFFAAHGFDKIAIAGILGNAMQESSLNPNTPGGGMWQQISNFGQGTGGSLQAQMEAMLPQIMGLRAAMNAASSPGAAAVIFEQGFEKAGIPALANRINYANEAFAGTLGAPLTGGAGAAGTIAAPHVEGSGTVPEMAQTALNEMATAANAFVAANTPAAGAGGAGGVSFAQAFPGFQYPKGSMPPAVARALEIAMSLLGRPYGFDPRYGLNAAELDCSGLVSTIVTYSGILDTGPAVSGRFFAGQSGVVAGPGKWITFGTRGAGSGPTGHVMMAINDAGTWKFFESGGGGPLGKPDVHEDAGWDGPFAYSHPVGYAAGGQLADYFKNLGQDERLTPGVYFGKNLSPAEAAMATAAGVKVHEGSSKEGIIKPPTTHPTKPKAPPKPSGVKLTTKDLQDLAEIGGQLNALETDRTNAQAQITSLTTRFSAIEGEPQFVNPDGSPTAAGIAQQTSDDQTLLGFYNEIWNDYTKELPIVTGALSKYLGDQSTVQADINKNTARITANKARLASDRVKAASIRKAILDLQKPTKNQVQAIQDSISGVRNQFAPKVLAAEKAKLAGTTTIANHEDTLRQAVLNASASKLSHSETSYLDALKQSVLNAKTSLQAAAPGVAQTNAEAAYQAAENRYSQAALNASVSASTHSTQLANARAALSQYVLSEAATDRGLTTGVTNADIAEKSALVPLEDALLTAKVAQQKRAAAIKSQTYKFRQELATITKQDADITKQDTSLTTASTSLKAILTGAGGGESTNAAVTLLETIAANLGTVDWATGGQFEGIDTTNQGAAFDTESEIISLNNSISQIGAQAAEPTAQDTQLIELQQEELLQSYQANALLSAQQGVITQMISALGAGGPLVGSFAAGGRIPASGMALVHKDEWVTPDPKGPFGSQLATGGIVGAAAAPQHHVEVNVHGDMGALVNTIDSRIDGRAPSTVAYKLGDRQRALYNAPGRPPVAVRR